MARGRAMLPLMLEPVVNSQQSLDTFLMLVYSLIRTDCVQHTKIQVSIILENNC